MTIDPFTTPAEAEREGRAKQARDFLALAMTPENVVQHDWDHRHYQINYANGVQAVRDALVGQGYALLTVRDELADIAGSLRRLAAMPSAMQYVADHVSALDDTIGAGAAELSEAIREHGEVVDSAVLGVADVMDRPRWWQWRLRRQVRAAANSPTAEVTA
jgi:hypothetical protein